MAPSDADISVHYLTRVEGHGNIFAEIRDGRLERVRFEIIEAPRFFEVFARGQHYYEVVHMASRICGICAVSHKCAALKATEAALGVAVSEQTALLRRLAYYGEVISSHILHLYFLALPDFLGAPSLLHLMDSDPETVRRGVRLKKLAYALCEVVVGRHTHPVAMTVGGFSFVHSAEKLSAMRARLEEAREDLRATVRLFQSIEIPHFERETEYVSLRHPDRYAFCEGDVFSSEGETIDAARYRDSIEEYVVPHSTAKHARWHRPQYMVGALARLNNNFDQLCPEAKQTAHALGLSAPCHNPFMITAAQLVECVHCLEASIQCIDTLLQHGIRAEDEQAQAGARAGRGVGAVEAPRGTLFHEYEYDENGKCAWANQVIPTAQNLANIEADMRAYVPTIIDEDKDVITRRLEMLARAYDPCISCSTHLVHVNFA